MAPPPPMLHMVTWPTTEQSIQQAHATFLQAQMPPGVTITKVERFQNEDGNYSWAIYVHLANNKDVPDAVITCMGNQNGRLPYDEIMNKLSLLGL